MVNVLLVILIVLVCFIILMKIDIVNYNPFKNKIRISDTFVEQFIPNAMALNVDTDNKNPLQLKDEYREKKPHRNLVFTSAGDNTQFHKLWPCPAGKPKSHDIMVVYYGDNSAKYNEYKQISDHIFKRKGSKFQNFHYIYNNYPKLIAKYDRFFILDDDIIFNHQDITKMFAISEYYKLSICGPTFKPVPECKISHPITISKNTNTMRYVSFIEVNVPLFSREALDNLMRYYDPILLGWGIDFLYIWANGNDKENSYSLIDAITCINPQDSKKSGSRELNKIKGVHQREQEWNKFKKKHAIVQVKHKNYKTIQLPKNIATLFNE